jgi:hypothetical protein
MYQKLESWKLTNISIHQIFARAVLLLKLKMMLKKSYSNKLELISFKIKFLFKKRFYKTSSRTPINNCFYLAPTFLIREKNI